MNHRPAALLLLVSLGASLTLACSGGEAQAGSNPRFSGRITLTGSSTCAPLIREAAHRFEKLHPGARIDVQSGGSSRGIADVLAGLADLGMSSRSLNEEESRTRSGIVFALDGVAFVTSAKNPVDSLTDAQLRAIFTGSVRDWGEVGGSPGPITVVGRAEGRSEVELVAPYLGIEARDFFSDAIAGENQQVVKQVASDPASISYLSVGTSELERDQGTPIRLLSLRGIEASAKTVADGSYPLVRPLVIVTDGDESPLANSFLSFLLSGQVEDLIRDFAFVAPSR